MYVIKVYGKQDIHGTSWAAGWLTASSNCLPKITKNMKHAITWVYAQDVFPLADGLRKGGIFCEVEEL